MKRVFIFLFVFQLLFAWDGIKKQSKAWDFGAKEGNSLLGDVKKNMDTRVNNPISKGQELSTFDGKQRKKVSITCAKESNLMRISYSTTSGGDINLYVEDDFDFDGNFKNNLYVSGISGICANGFIICNGGTWNNCKYYLLEFYGNNLTYKKTVISDMSNCYCINNSCGSLSSNSKVRVLTDIAGVIASIIRDRYYIVSNVEVDNSYAYIRGKSINCKGESVPAGMNDVELESKAEQAKFTDSNYQVMIDTAKNANKHPVEQDVTDNLATRRTSVSKSAKWNENDQAYSYSDNGKPVSGNIFTKDPREVKYCEVEYFENSPDAFSDKTTRANSTSSSISKKTKIIECIEKPNGDWVCPVGSGESIKHDCGKIDNLAEVAAAFEALNEAAKDFTCSTK